MKPSTTDIQAVAAFLDPQDHGHLPDLDTCQRVGKYLRQLLATAYPQCGGNHAGPRCADPECWNGGAAQGDDTWHPAETMPEDPNRWLQVRAVEIFRFTPYKPGSNEAKRGLRGRWQRHNGYGFQNCERPEGEWCDAEVKEDQHAA